MAFQKSGGPGEINSQPGGGSALAMALAKARSKMKKNKGKKKLPKSFKGKSTKLGYGGRAAKLKAQGVPGGVIGNIARNKQAAPGQKNYHGGHSNTSGSAAY